MTYNFDPERWHVDRLMQLEARRESGELDQAAFEKAREKLDEDLERMVSRLDGTYQIPGHEHGH